MARQEDLKVCEKCGWYDDKYGHANTCDPEGGALADKLIKLIGVPATKLGYGNGHVTFEFSENKSLTLGVHRERVRVDRLFWLPEDNEDGLSIEHITALVKALAQVSRG